MSRSGILPFGIVAHIIGPGHEPSVAVGFFLLGLGASVAVYWLSEHPRAAPRAMKIVLTVVAVVGFGFATLVPFLYDSGPSPDRPSSTARLRILSPRPGDTLIGDPADVHVILRLDGGRIVSLPSKALVPNEGHIHVYLDDRLVAMTELDASIIALAGAHTLRVEFVASDHGPFRPPVTTSVEFRVRS